MFTVTFSNGPCSYEQMFEVRETPEVDITAIVVNDFTQNLSITINLGPEETLENTQFSIDGGMTFQADNVFDNLAPDLYQLVVDNGCITYEEQVLVGGIKNFFTPNGDNENDIWFLDNASFFPGYQIAVFDRYGKLLAIVTERNPIWDGRYQNNDLPSANYWYRLSLGDGRSIKGNFALKR